MAADYRSELKFESTDFALIYDDEDDGAVSGESFDYDKTISPEDAFVESLNVCGAVNLEYMANRTGLTVSRLIDGFEGRFMWRDPGRYDPSCPEYGWLTREQYIRGNVFQLLEEAKKANLKTGLYQSNIDLLSSVLPPEVKASDIVVTLGATWVPAEVYNRFMEDLLHLGSFSPKAVYDSYFGKWRLLRDEMFPRLLYISIEYGTGRMDAVDVIEHTMNVSPILIFDTIEVDGVRKRVLNRQETMAARDKQGLVIEKFKEYLDRNPDEMRILQELYSQKYGYLIPHFSGDILKLPGLNPEVNLYKHQRDAVARILMSDSNVLLAHAVGSGKTYEFEIGVYERLRMGLSRKALIIVPNAVFESTVSTFSYLYPNFEVTAISPKEFRKDVRTGTIEKMLSAESGVFIMAYSSFDMLKMSRQYHLVELQRKLEECASEAEDTTDAVYKNRLIRECEKIRKRLSKCMSDETDEPEACFDRMNVDLLVVDECHNYKNIKLHTNVEGVVGLNGKGSARAENLLEKCDFIRRNGGRLIFATGTPLTNSLADLYVLQRYLQPVELEMLKISRFNEWINSFCMQKSEFEIDVTSASFRFRTRFDRFHNLPELMGLFGNVCDFYQTDADELGLPDFSGSINIRVPRSEAQKRYIESIVKRTEALRSGRSRRREDNYLKITGDGRKCALDMRLLPAGELIREEDGETMEDAEALVVKSAEHNKVSAAAENILDLYRRYPHATQIVFCDISTPKKEFNVYDALREVLVREGIPEKEIAFIQDGNTEAVRSKMLLKLDAGKIRIMLGSTQMLGTGVNVQKHLIAVHHLDAPWKPAEMVQRDGRAIRQGNENRQVFVYRYVTESSFDAYTWQILESKQRFIASFLSGNMDQTNRIEGDIGDMILDYAEIKALAVGNPLIRERIITANRLEKARASAANRRKDLRMYQMMIADTPAEIRRKEKQAEAMREDVKCFRNHRRTISKSVKLTLGKRILNALKEYPEQPDERRIPGLWYRGFSVILPAQMKREKPYILLRRSEEICYAVQMKRVKEEDVTDCLDRVLEEIKLRSEKLLNDARLLEESISEAQQQLNAGNRYDDKVAELISELNDIDTRLKEGA